MTFYEVALDNAKIQIHCHEEAPIVLEPIVIDVPATQVRLLRSSVADGYTSDTSGIPINPSSTTIDLYAYFGGPTGDTANYIYWEKFDGHDADSLDWIPTTPAGYALADIRPYIIAYTAGTQVVEEATGWHPPAEKSPFIGVTSSLISFDTFSSGWTSSNPKQIAGWNYPTSWATIAGALPDPIHLVAGGGASCHIIFQGYGFRFTYEGA